MSKKESISRPIAAEDVRVGMYIAVLYVVAEYVPGCWCEVSQYQKLEARRFVHLPTGSIRPLKVMEACLPFVLVNEPRGRIRILDVRRCRLAQLSPRFGRRVFNVLREASKAPTAGNGNGSDEDDE